MPDNTRSFDEMFAQAGVADEKTKKAVAKEPSLLERVTGGFMSTPEASMQDFMGRAPNAASMALAGAPNPAAMAGLGAAGFLMKPSDTPGTDAGALAGELGTNKLVDMFMGGRGRLAKAAMNAGGVGLGAFLGHQVDRLSNPDKEIPTPWGQIALYSGGSAAGLALSDWLAKPNVLSAMQSKADRIAEMSGLKTKYAFGGQSVGYPLSMGEANSPNIFTKVFGPGTRAEQTLGQAQNEYAQKAFDKFINDTWASAAGKFDEALSIRRDIKKDLQTLRSDPALQKEVPVMAHGMDTGTTTTKTDWTKLQSAVGFRNAEEADAFFKAIRANPETFVNRFMGSEKDVTKGLLAVRGLRTYMNARGMEDGWANLGKAMVFRALEKHGGFIDTPNGLVVSGESFHKALFGGFGGEKLRLALGKEAAEGLELLATVMQNADPAKKLGHGGKRDEASAVLSYAGKKAMFMFASTAAGAVAGTQVGAGAVGSQMLGAAIGTAVGVPLYSLVSSVIHSPTLARGLWEASQGNMTAANKVLRTIMSPAVTGVEEKPSKPANRIPLFR